MTISGELTFKGKITTPTRTLRKQVFQLLDRSQRDPQRHEFELINENCGLIDEHKIGDHILVHFRIRSSHTTHKLIPNLVALRIEKIEPTDIF